MVDLGNGWTVTIENPRVDVATTAPGLVHSNLVLIEGPPGPPGGVTSVDDMQGAVSLAGLYETPAGAQTKADNAVATHSADTTGVHGIADTSALETTSGATTKVANHAAVSSGVHGVSGFVVGTTSTQTLTNKTLTTPTINNPLITLPVIVRARLTTTKAALAGGSTTDVAPVTEDEDTAGAHNATTGVFTVPAGQGGLYLITFSFRADNVSGSNGTGTMWMAVNGTAKRPGASVGPTTVPIQELNNSRLVRLAAGDTVKFQFQASGTTVKLWGMSDSFDTGYEIVKVSV